MVEQGTENPRVGSSILSLGTTEFQGRIIAALFRLMHLMPSRPDDASGARKRSTAHLGSGVACMLRTLPEAALFVLHWASSRGCAEFFL